MFIQDFILNGEGRGEMAEMLQAMRFDTGLLRPFIDDDNRKYCIVANGRGGFDQIEVRELIANGIDSPVFNATSLRKEEWIRIDEKVLRAARYQMNAWTDLAGANSLGGFNGMATTMLEHETINDPGEAQVDMDGLATGKSDAPNFVLQGIPLPITHVDFWIPARKLAASRQKGMPISTVMGEVAGRRIGEMVEKTTIGTNTGITYGGLNTAGTYGRTPTVYGYTNFPARITYTSMRNPSNFGGWTPSMTVDDVLAILDLLYLNKFRGPFMMYHSNDWTKYLEKDYILTGGNVATQTLRERLKACPNIVDVRRLDMMFGAAPTLQSAADKYDNLNPFTIVLVQMTDDVAEAINGMDITTVQWESKGGMQLNFKVMCIQVPRLKADQYNNCGIAHGTCSS